MSVEDEHVYPPSRVFTQDLNFQRAAYPYTNGSPDSLEVPESISGRIRSPPAQETLCRRVLTKLKEWLDRFLSYLS